MEPKGDSSELIITADEVCSLIADVRAQFVCLSLICTRMRFDE